MRKTIIETASQVFAQKGYFNASMDEIAEKSGVAKGTLYYYFPGKEQLFSSVLTEGIEWMCGCVNLAAGTCTSGGEVIDSVINQLTAIFDDYPQVTELFFNLPQANLDVNVVKDIDTEKNKFYNLISGILEQGSSCGMVRDLDYGAAVPALIKFIYQYYTDARKNGRDSYKIRGELYTIISKGILLS